MKYLLKFNEAIASREELYPKNEIEHKGVIEPALMTFGEYFDRLQKGSYTEYHDEGTYAYSIETKPWYYINVKDGTWEKIKNQKINRLNIEYYKKSSKMNFHKRDPEGEYLRDKDNNLISYTEENYIARKKAGYLTEEIQFCAYHKDEDLVIGSAADEWNCVLVSVLKEYQGNGIGDTLLDLYMHYYPHKSTGGVTPQGEKAIKRFHDKLVRKYLQNGIYSDLVRKGELTATRAKEIIASIDKDYKPKIGSELSKTYGGSGNLMYYINDSTVIIFDLDVKMMLDKRDNYPDLFMKKLIKCYIYLSTFYTNPEFKYSNLWTVYAEDEKYLKLGLDMLLSSGEKISDYYLDKNFDEKTKVLIEKVFNSGNYIKKEEKGFLIGQKCNVIKEKVKKYNFESLKKDSKKWFKMNDKHSQFENHLLEFADSITKED